MSKTVPQSVILSGSILAPPICSLQNSAVEENIKNDPEMSLFRETECPLRNEKEKSVHCFRYYGRLIVDVL